MVSKTGTHDPARAVRERILSASVSFRNEPGIGTYFSVKNVFRLCAFLLLDHGTVS